MSRDTFVSFRASPVESARLKRLAAGQGVSLQHLMRDMVKDRLGRAQPLTLGGVVSTLRDRRSDLTARGVEKVWVFGSVARGEEKPGSDVDLIVEIAATARMSLTGFAHLKQDLEEMLGGSVDLAEWRTLEPRVRRFAERDAVAVF